MDEKYVVALNQSYCFVKGRLVFEDGIGYSLAEAITLNDPRLTAEDIQAIHLVKRIFDGEIQSQPGAVRQFVYNSVKADKTLDELANEMGPPPFLH